MTLYLRVKSSASCGQVKYSRFVHIHIKKSMYYWCCQLAFFSNNTNYKKTAFLSLRELFELLKKRQIQQVDQNWEIAINHCNAYFIWVDDPSRGLDRLVAIILTLCIDPNYIVASVWKWLETEKKRKMKYSAVQCSRRLLEDE